MKHLIRFKLIFNLLFLGIIEIKAQTVNTNNHSVDTAEISHFIQGQMDSLEIPGISISIIKDAEVVYYHTFGIRNEKGEPVNQQTLFEAASMTKPLFSYAVHQLIKRGILNLDTPLYRYYRFKDIETDPRYTAITARTVLSHTTGLPNWRIKDSLLTLTSDPGKMYTYSGEGFEYLGRVIEHLTGKTVDEVIKEEVFIPSGMNTSYLIKNVYVMEHVADGRKDNKDWGKNFLWLRPGVSFSLCTESREYTRFLMMLLKETEIPGSVFDQMILPQLQIGPGKFVCLGLFQEQTSSGSKYGHSGNNNNRYTSNFEIYPKSRFAYVFFINCARESEFTTKLNAFLRNRFRLVE